MRKILIIGCGQIGTTAALGLAKKGLEIEFIAPSQVKEMELAETTHTDPPRGYRITNTRPFRFNEKPITRQERRKQRRTNNKK